MLFSVNLYCGNEFYVDEMKAPEIPVNEHERLFELHSYSLLDTMPEEDYGNITELASHICQTPISLITLVDHNRQWFKSAYGIDASETPREHSFCAHAINAPYDILEVPDSRQDARFHDNPFVLDEPKIVFYAGVPLVTKGGFALGTLCVADSKPHELTPEQRNALKALSNNVVKLFELRKNKMELERVRKELEKKNKDLARFASIAAHDLKTPLANISSIVNLLEEVHCDNLDVDGKDLVRLLDDSSQQLRDLIDGILSQTHSDLLLDFNKEEIILPQFFKNVVSLVDHRAHFKVEYPTQSQTLRANKHALKQILLNLISNGIKYNFKDDKKIMLDFEEVGNHYQFSVTDNGNGIAPEDQQRIFNLFERVGNNKIENGHGIGLNTVKTLVESLGGEIILQSVVDVGTKISFTMPK